MKRLLSLCIATALSLSTFPAAEARGVISGRQQRAAQEERNIVQAEIHRMLQDYLHAIHDQRSRSRRAYAVNRRLRTVERELNLSEDMQEILKMQDDVRVRLLAYYTNLPRVSRRVLRERTQVRRERERCLAQTPDPCTCPCGHVPATPKRETTRTKPAVLERKTDRLQRNLKREERREQRRAKVNVPRPRTMPRPLSPRHLWKKAEEQEREHNRRLAEIKERYGPRPVYLPEV